MRFIILYILYYILYYTAGICNLIETVLYYSMEFIREYWPQLLTFIGIVVTFTTMRVDIDVLKEKVKTLFQLLNKE